MAVAIVTGAASGFGAATARRLSRDGYGVMLADLNRDDAARNAQLIVDTSGRAASCACDVGNRDSFSEMVDRTRAELGEIDVIVNNAGYTHPRSAMEDVTEDDFHKVVAVNFAAIFYTGKFIVPLMKRNGNGGSIVNISSSAAMRPGMALTWYAAAKAAVRAATQGMAMELSMHNIRVNAIAPGLGDTGLLTRFIGAEDTREAREKFGGSIPLGRLCQPEDVANAVGFLVGPDAAFITGHCLPVDGGFLAGNFSPAARPGIQ
ncbi:SDR family oxidoreductase [Yoonia sp.]|jgi:3-oxoacyl-[acyl-carrier protein] reductase|uniref:SDR family oxidoreductase n=1 Tax=Yoonia sp. TaxID=2212373 RepID=UPI004048001E